MRSVPGTIELGKKRNALNGSLEGITVMAKVSWMNELEANLGAPEPRLGQLLTKHFTESDKQYKALLDTKRASIVAEKEPFIRVAIRWNDTAPQGAYVLDDISDSMDRELALIDLSVDREREVLHSWMINKAFVTARVNLWSVKFRPWYSLRKDDVTEENEKLQPTGDSRFWRSLSVQAWLLVAGVFVVLSSLHIWLGLYVYEAMLKDMNNSGTEHSSSELQIVVFFYVVLSFISFMFSIYSLIKSNDKELSKRDEELSRKFTYVVSSVLAITLLATCFHVWPHGSTKNEAIAHCAVHLAQGGGVIVIFHILHEQFFRFLSTYLNRQQG